MFGTLCVGLFAVDKITGAATGNGLFYGGGMTLLIAQLKGIVAVAVYTLAVSLVFWFVDQGDVRPARQQGTRKRKASTSASTARTPTSSRARESGSSSRSRRKTCRDSAYASKSRSVDGILQIRRRCMRSSPCRPIAAARVSHPAADIPSVPPAVVMLSGAQFVLGCAIVAALLLAAGRVTPLPVWLLAAEVFATILGLFVFGSFRYQIHKNALTYGMVLVIVATFCGLDVLGMARQIADAGWWAWAQRAPAVVSRAWTS